MNWSFIMIKKAAATVFIACCPFLAAQEISQHSLNPKPLKAKTTLSNKNEIASSLSHRQIESSEIMIIAPEIRAKDFKSAFDYLTNTSNAQKISVKLKNGHSLVGITAMDMMPGGTIIIFQTNTTQGIKHHVINIENIQSIGND